MCCRLLPEERDGATLCVCEDVIGRLRQALDNQSDDDDLYLRLTNPAFCDILATLPRSVG